MIKTYTYKIKPDKKVEVKFQQWLDVCRVVYNLGKEVKEESYRKGLKLSNYDLQKQLTDVKQEFDWMYNVHSNTLIAMLDQLDNGYKKFYTDLKKGNKTNKPKWMSKKKQKSLPFKSISIKDNNFNLPKFGRVKVFNFKNPKGELKTAIIVRGADGLFLKVAVEEIDKPTIRENQSVVALDMGLKYFFVTSDAEFVENPKLLFKYLAELRIENRKLSRMKKGGSNWKKQVKVLQLLYLKIKRSRLDFLQKQSTLIANKYSDVIIENLNISGMAKNKSLSKHILDCGWGVFFSILEYKTNVIKVNPKYTSQRCSKCGHTCKENRATQSFFECISCGYSENADLQATFNLFQRGQTLMGANVVQ